MTEITKLISIVLAISLASERLVTLIKTFFPSLASTTADPGTGVPPPVAGKEQRRQLLVMAIAFISAWLTASFCAKGGNFDPFGSIDIGPPATLIPVWVFGLLASGGSAFWTSLLGYVKAVKGVNTQTFLQQKMVTRAQFQSGGVIPLTHTIVKSKALLKTIRFAVAFTGGAGDLTIKIDGIPEFSFDQDGFKDVSLSGGVINYTAYGSASPGPGGGATLTVSGEVITNSPQVYGPGLIPPNTHAMLI